ncbi:MAG: ASCH domain-containing protein [Pararhodobacter sp.]
MPITLDAALARYPGAQTFRFGDSPTLTEELLALVRAGRKRATCSALAEIAAGAAAPQVGRRDIALDGAGNPALVIETLRLVELRFCDMPEDLALMEGEDETLESWRAQHQRYYERIGIFAPDMPLIWEEFCVIEDFAATDPSPEAAHV